MDNRTSSCATLHYGTGLVRSQCDGTPRDKDDKVDIDALIEAHCLHSYEHGTAHATTDRAHEKFSPRPFQLFC